MGGWNKKEKVGGDGICQKQLRLQMAEEREKDKEKGWRQDWRGWRMRGMGGRWKENGGL